MKNLVSKLLCVCIASVLLGKTVNAQIPGILQHGRFPRKLNEQSASDSLQGIQNNLSGVLVNKAPKVLWQKCIGGSEDDYANNIIKLSDGNYLTCGSTNSLNGDFNASQGDYDAFLMKTDRSGNIIWKKSYGGSQFDQFYSLVESGNGDIYAIGQTASDDGQVTGHHGIAGSTDVWLVITNSNGKLLSQHCYGGSNDELGAWKIIINNEGNILFVGATSSNDGDVSKNNGDYDAWLVKLNRSLDIDFSVTFGGTFYEDWSGIMEIKGGYLVTGIKGFNNYDSPDFEKYFDAHAARLDEKGKVVWYRRYGGSRSDDCNSSVPSGDGNIVLTGHTSSSDGDASANVGFNAWILKVNAQNGDIMWQNFFGVAKDTAAGFNLFATKDGGFVLVGAIAPNEEAPFNTWDNYAAKVDANGKALWTKRFGGSAFDDLNAGVEEDDGGLLMVGGTASNNGDVRGNHGGPEDAWLVKLGEQKDNDRNTDSNTYSLKITGDTETAGKFLLNNFPNSFSNSTTISFFLPPLEKTTPGNEQVSIQIYDMIGRLIKVLANGQMQPGTHQLIWNATSETGNIVAAGVYILRVQEGNDVETRKLFLVK